MNNKGVSKILVSCQNMRALRLLRKFLKDLSYEVVEARGNGPELINTACLERPDIIIIDFQTPSLEVVRSYRDIYSKVNTPILMVTTTNAPADTIRVFDLNSEGYLTEPFKANELKEWFKVILATARKKQASV